MTASVATSDNYCRDCGAVIKARAEICPKCGVRQRTALTGSRNRVTAALFAFFLGGLGAHKFYLGQPGLGVLYLIFCWTFIPAIVAFIETIIFLTMNDEAFGAKYNYA